MANSKKYAIILQDMKVKFNLDNTKLIIGLGNPDQKYEDTYHNAGFLFIEYLISKNPAISNFKFPIFKPFKYAKLDNIILIKPSAYMNNSGPAVQKVLKYFKSKTKEILIVHDDSDIELGKYKLSFGQSSAGHKGVESIIRTLKTKDFWRLRIGIRPKHESGIMNQESGKRTKAGLFVLKKITLRHKKILNEVFEQVEKRLFVLFKIQRKTQTKTH